MQHFFERTSYILGGTGLGLLFGGMGYGTPGITLAVFSVSVATLIMGEVTR